jgi:hypothetical protein
MKKNSKVNYNWFKEWGFVDKSFSFLRKGLKKFQLKLNFNSFLGEIGDWLNHFDVQQSKDYDQMVSTRLSPSIPPLNYGISLEDQQKIYDLDKQGNDSKKS